MKNKVYIAFIVALMFALLTTSVSFAGGQGSATPFKAVYDNSLTGHTECSGARVVQGNGKVKDSQTCILTDASPSLTLGTYVGDPSFCIETICYFWVSDFDGQIAYHVTFTIVDNGDGTLTLDAVAYY